MNLTMQRVADHEFLSRMRSDPAALSAALPEGVTRLERVPVAVMPGGFGLTADVYCRSERPAHQRPALIFMHDWARGEQPALAGNRQCAYFALKADIYCAALYYRQPRDGIYPAALEDLKCALRWVRSRAADLAIDPDRIIAMGSSAGTLWTWLAAATGGMDVYNSAGGYAGFSSAVNLAVMVAGICDLAGDFGHHPNATAIMGGTVDELPERYREASPLQRLHAGMPPVIMIHGERDETCPLRSARKACETLRHLGVRSKLVVCPRCGHGVDGFGFNLGGNLDKILEFVYSQWPDLPLRSGPAGKRRTGAASHNAREAGPAMTERPSSAGAAP